MAARERYEPHCPARDCQAGRAQRLHRANDPALLNIPKEALKGMEPKDLIFLCSYSQLIWFQKPGPQAWTPILWGVITI